VQPNLVMGLTLVIGVTLREQQKNKHSPQEPRT